jgi:hypothetical protein
MIGLDFVKRILQDPQMKIISNTPYFLFDLLPGRRLYRPEAAVSGIPIGNFLIDLTRAPVL